MASLPMGALWTRKTRTNRCLEWVRRSLPHYTLNVLSTMDCDHCGARFRAPDLECTYCGAARPSRPGQSPEGLTPLGLSQDPRKLLESLTDQMPEPIPGFWFLHGGIFILVGGVFTATIIGAIVGIPAILIGLNSWKKGLGAFRRRT